MTKNQYNSVPDENIEVEDIPTDQNSELESNAKNSKNRGKGKFFRFIKRKKSEKRKINSKVNESPQSESVKDRSINYLHLWDTDRANWKFQKLLQIWLIKNAFKKEEVDKEDFKALLRYVKEIKGQFREVVKTTCQAVMEGTDYDKNEVKRAKKLVKSIVDSEDSSES